MLRTDFSGAALAVDQRVILICQRSAHGLLYIRAGVQTPAARKTLQRQVGRKQAKDTEMQSCLPDDPVHERGRATFPAISPADVQMADPAGSPVFGVRVDVKTAYPDQLGARNEPPQAFPGLGKTIGASVKAIRLIMPSRIEKHLILFVKFQDSGFSGIIIGRRRALRSLFTMDMQSQFVGIFIMTDKFQT